MEILKPEELKEKFSDPWVAPYEKVLTMVDGDMVTASIQKQFRTD